MYLILPTLCATDLSLTLPYIVLFLHGLETLCFVGFDDSVNLL